MTGERRLQKTISTHTTIIPINHSLCIADQKLQLPHQVGQHHFKSFANWGNAIMNLTWQQ